MLELRLELPRREFDVDIHINIPTGTTYCLYGPSGSGKSSILSVIAGFERSYRLARLRFANTWYLDTAGNPVVNVPTWQRGFGYMEQTAHLFPHLSVRENITYGMSRQNSDQWLETLIERLDLGPYLAAKPAKLSGGQKQRVALARALAVRPQLLLLDEPFSALDWQARLSLQQSVADLQKKLGFTALLVTHQLTEAQRLASTIGLIDRGQILQEGNPTALFSHPTSRRAAQLLGYTYFLPATTRQIFAVHPDCALIGRYPGKGVVVSGKIAAQYEYAGRRRIKVVLPQCESTFVEVNLSIQDTLNNGDTIELTFVNPPFFLD